MNQERNGQEGDQKQHQLEEERDALHRLNPFCQDLLSCSALVKEVNAMSTPQQVLATSGKGRAGENNIKEI